MSPNPIAPSPSCSRAYSTSTDHAAPNVTLKMRMVSTRVRTAAWCRTQRTPSAMSCRRWVVCVSARCGGSDDRGRPAPPPRRRAVPRPRTASACPTANRNAPSGGPTSWLTVTNPAMIRLFASARSSRCTSIGTSVLDALSANVSAVPSRNIATSTSQIVATSTATAVASSSQDQGPQRVDDDDEPAPVQPVGHRAGPQPEQQRRQPLEQRRQRDEERVVASGTPPAADRPPARCPSPRFELHDEASSHRNPVPSRRGTTVSTIRLTAAGR